MWPDVFCTSKLTLMFAFAKKIRPFLKQFRDTGFDARLILLLVYRAISPQCRGKYTSHFIFRIEYIPNTDISSYNVTHLCSHSVYKVTFVTHARLNKNLMLFYLAFSIRFRCLVSNIMSVWLETAKIDLITKTDWYWHGTVQTYYNLCMIYSCNLLL